MKKVMKIISDGTVKNTQIMLGDVDLVRELRIKSITWKQNGQEEPTCLLEMYGVQLDAKGEIFTEIIDIEDQSKNGDSAGDGG